MHNSYSDLLIPACGGTESPFIINGVKWLYCYHPYSGMHCYLNLDSDLATFHREFHPSFAPQYEGQIDKNWELALAKERQSIPNCLVKDFANNRETFLVDDSDEYY